MWLISILTVFYSVFAVANPWCENFSLNEDVLSFLNNDIRQRVDNLHTLVESCPTDQVDLVLSQLVMEQEAEWFLKETALDYMGKQSFCEENLQNYLFDFVMVEQKDWHVRRSVIWILSGTPAECAESVIQFFVEFIQQDQPELNMEMVLFREQMIYDLFWALVRLGVNDQNNIVSGQLKNIAMNENMNVFFRTLAIRALQDMSVFYEQAAQNLYEIVRDSVTTKKSNGFETYYESIINERNKQIREIAFSALLEVMKGQSEFLKTLSGTSEPTAYRWKALDQHILPQDVTQYVSLALQNISTSSQINGHYKERASQALTR